MEREPRYCERQVLAQHDPVQQEVVEQRAVPQHVDDGALLATRPQIVESALIEVDVLRQAFRDVPLEAPEALHHRRRSVRHQTAASAAS